MYRILPVAVVVMGKINVYLSIAILFLCYQIKLSAQKTIIKRFSRARIERRLLINQQ
jgi:hypothetical protein